MIYLVDRSSVGNVHIGYNASIILLIRKIYPTEKIIFIADSAHIKFIKDYIGLSEMTEVQFENCAIVRTDGYSGNFRKFAKKIQEDRHFIEKLLATSHSDDLIFFCSIPPISLPFITGIFSNFAKRQIIITLHGELEILFSKHKSVKDKILSICYKTLFKVSNERFSLLLLNKISKEILLNRLAIKTKHIFEINHPHIETPLNQQNQQEFHHGNFGHVGSLGLRKNGHLLFKLADKLQNYIRNKEMVINAIGPIESDVDSYKNGFVLSINNNNADYIERNSYELAIKKLDYALFFFSVDQFIFRASGALYDVIQFEKPIVAFKHPLFDDINCRVGEIGYLCESLEEMADVLTKISSNSEDTQYKRNLHIKNIKKYKQLVSLDAIAEDFKNQIQSYKQ